MPSTNASTGTPHCSQKLKSKPPRSTPSAFCEVNAITAINTEAERLPMSCRAEVMMADACASSSGSSVVHAHAVSGIINFSQVPLTIASWFGTTMTGFSFLVLVAIIVRKLIFDDPVPGWASTICVIIFIGGLQLFCLGIMGQYIAKTYMEVKQRPHYIIAESNKKDFTPIR